MSGVRNEIVVYVRTGDVHQAGTNANVAIKLHDIHGSSTDEICLNNFLRKDFQRGKLDVFELANKKTKSLGKLHKLEVFRDGSGVDNAWFVERITVENRAIGDVHIFPIFRWLRPHYHYIFKEYDTCLPQDDDEEKQRKEELEEKKKDYAVDPDRTEKPLPARVKTLPNDEMFSLQYTWDIVKLGGKQFLDKLTRKTTGTWKNLDDIKNVYTRETFDEPAASKLWQEDWFFGYQRLNGPVPNLIRLCTQIPTKMAVKEVELAPFFEGNTLQEVMSQKRLFYISIDILNKLEYPGKTEKVVCAPIVLLYKNKANQLLPIAMQLHQEPGPHNPVFLPSDDKYTWLLAKTWYNHAEASYHQSLTHLGFTHLLMEGFCVALYRNVSVSHPIYKLLEPHTMYLMAINKFADKILLPVGGSIDKVMSIGREGALNLIREGSTSWRLDRHGTLPEDMKERGVFDEDVLPGYYYRDDCLLLYNAIHKYVTEYVNLYYDSPSRLTNDPEIQSWAREMVRSRAEGGMGIQGVPGNGEFSDTSQLIQTLTSIIFTCSVQHAAVNFPQYDYYGFPPVYTPMCRGKPPSDKRSRTEADIISCLPDIKTALDMMGLAKILSQKGSKSLGDFEIQYVFDPKAKEVVERFRNDLRNVGAVITQRNSFRDTPYEYLHPDAIPNSISI